MPAERVDVVARAVTALLTAPEAAGRAFHLVHPTSLTLPALFEALRRAGHTLEPVSAAEWWRRVRFNAQHPAVHPLASLSEVARFMLSTDEDHVPPRFHAEDTWKVLRDRGVTPEPLDDAFLDLLVSHVDPPAAALERRRPKPLPHQHPCGSRGS
ncbi:hypothetical protein [Streptomyces sp. Ac-502]|uniref:hypothetical protein n=1 Tax=Streptomyces sp. Ac-502 TaxID=3342801 RepID=UPI00386268B8